MMYNKLVYDYAKKYWGNNLSYSNLQEVVLMQVLRALEDQEEVMELDWATLSQISDISVRMWNEYYDGEDVPEARDFLLRMSRPEKEVVLEDYL